MSHVRRARLDDAEGIAAVHVASWREAYAHVMPHVVLDGLDVEERSRFWRNVLASRAAEVCVAEVCAAEQQGETVGFAATRRTDDGPQPVEVAGIYLLSSHHDRGLGQRLLDAVLGEQPAFLWVAKDNRRAVGFYSRNRFRPDGERREVPEWGNLEIIRMVR